MHNPGVLYIQTTKSSEEIRAALKQWEPWRMKIEFSNGLSTKDLDTFEPFNNSPLFKLRLIEKHLKLDEFRGRDVLDIGFNCGYNSIALAQEYDMNVIALDTIPRHKEVASYLAQISGVSSKIDWRLDDAMFFSRPQTFDLVLHLGTLYHLPNPLLSLENAARNLRKGGWLALETVTSKFDDPKVCRFIRGLAGDKSNYWALSLDVIEEMLDVYGMEDMTVIREGVWPSYKELSLARPTLLAKKVR